MKLIESTTFSLFKEPLFAKPLTRNRRRCWSVGYSFPTSDAASGCHSHLVVLFIIIIMRPDSPVLLTNGSIERVSCPHCDLTTTHNVVEMPLISVIAPAVSSSACDVISFLKPIHTSQ